MNHFTDEEIKAAKETKAEILHPDTPDVLKSVYMAGEICMWDELQSPADQDELWEEVQILLDDFAIPKNVLELVKSKFHLTRKP